MAASLIVPTRGQHTVSRVVLRRFSWNSKITVYDRQRDILYPTGTRAVFKMRNFDGHDPVAAEERWREVENKMHRVYGLVEHRAVLNDPDALTTLRDLMAVHWARSPATRSVHERITAELVAQSIDDFASQHQMLARSFTQATGLVASGPGALDWFNRETHRRVVAEHAEQMFSARNAIHFDFARSRFAQSALQIGYAPDGSEFVIGDAPVITTKPGHRGVGPHQGVALGDANTVSLPISSKVIVGLGPHPEEFTLTSAQVDEFNAMQLFGYVRWIGWKPGGSADKQMRKEITARTVLR